LLTGDPADRRLDEGAHEAYVVPEGYRGIQETVVGPGRYYVNTLAISPIVIPTTNQTLNGRPAKSSTPSILSKSFRKTASRCSWRCASSFASSLKTRRSWWRRLAASIA
jgi:hypothetical protein